MLTSRQKEILNRIILFYEKTGEPVGSHAICDDLGLSSATIRNEMSELSGLGFLEQPHTSAGRVPSQSAYRLYVNELMKKIPLSDKEKNHIISLVGSAATPEIVLSRICDALSEITGHMSISSTPCDSQAGISKIDVIPIGYMTCLLIVLTDSGIIKSVPCRIFDEVSIPELEDFSKFCTEKIKNISLINIDRGFIQGMISSYGISSLKFAGISETLYSLIDEACKTEIKASGELNLFSRGDIPIEKAKKILSLLKSRDTLLNILNENSNIKIGDEMNNDAFKNASLVSSDYYMQNRVGGRIGIIGATHMNYAKIIPLVSFAAQTAGNCISKFFKPDGRDIYVQIS